MKQILINDKQHYQMSHKELDNLLHSTVMMFIEYRDVHGFDEDAAEDAAVSEMLEGIEAMISLQEAGEL